MSARETLRKLILAAVRDAVQLPLEGENLDFDRTPGEPWGSVYLRMGPTYVATLGEGGSDGLSGYVQVDLRYPSHLEDDLAARTVQVLGKLHAGRRLSSGLVTVDLVSHGRVRTVTDEPVGLLRNLTINWSGRLPR
jgi:hypothetical protein